MIEINLLPRKELLEQKKRRTLIGEGVIALISVVVVLMILFSWAAHVKGKVENRNKEIVKLQAELDKLKENEKKIEQLREGEAIVQRKIDVIKKLEQKKIGPVRVLDEIALRIPQKMWLTALKNQQALLSLEGVAIDNETIALFMTNLENSDQFENVELKVAQETKVEDFALKKFSLSCTARVMKEVKEEKEKPPEKPAAAEKSKRKAKKKN
ncbi:MAG: PilN domain-containing protein [Deltaproteobacteria bacterium]|nr:PilN domain-containing protein [Deltaproteobacteria bacterium]